MDQKITQPGLLGRGARGVSRKEMGSSDVSTPNPEMAWAGYLTSLILISVKLPIPYPALGRFSFTFPVLPTLPLPHLTVLESKNILLVPETLKR